MINNINFHRDEEFIGTGRVTFDSTGLRWQPEQTGGSSEGSSVETLDIRMRDVQFHGVEKPSFLAGQRCLTIMLVGKESAGSEDDDDDAIPPPLFRLSGPQIDEVVAQIGILAANIPCCPPGSDSEEEDNSDDDGYHAKRKK
eukprot:PhF_6_TR38848/c0_g1_i1/m.58093